MVGSLAKRQAVTNHERTVSSIKRQMGTNYKVNIDGHKYTPQEISAMILQKLKADAEAFLGEPVSDAVITVPAYFTDAQRQATKDAGKIAGLNVQRIINEPTAAALAYGIDKEAEQKIMVYDLGGGTFDVSILDISSGVIEVLATAGNNHLGGDDFDQCIVDYLVQEFKKENKIDLSRDSAAMQRIREAAEKAKIELSAMTQTSIELPYITVGKNGPLHMDIPLSRAKFNDLTYHLVQATREPVNQAINDSGVSIAQISKVLMVGGSSRIPAVQDLVQSITGSLPFKGINPDECVAMGACCCWTSRRSRSASRRSAASARASSSATPRSPSARARSLPRLPASSRRSTSMSYRANGRWPARTRSLAASSSPASAARRAASRRSRSRSPSTRTAS